MQARSGRRDRQGHRGGGRWWLLLPLLAVAACTGPATRDVAPPPTDVSLDYQIGGTYPVPDDVGIVVRDRTEDPAGFYDVCYVNAFQAQPGELAQVWDDRRDLLVPREEYADGGIPDGARPSRRADAEQYWAVDGDWDELILDTSTAASRADLLEVVGRWVDGCADAGFDAVEADNLDSFLRLEAAYRLSEAGNLAFAAMLAARAHDRGLAFGQKNTAEVDAAEAAAAGFDFAVVEECGEHGECGDFVQVHGDRVLAVEYSDAGLVEVCARWPDLAAVRRDRGVVTPAGDGYRRATCPDSG